jgi:hypothetical protein
MHVFVLVTLSACDIFLAQIKMKSHTNLFPLDEKQAKFIAYVLRYIFICLHLLLLCDKSRIKINLKYNLNACHFRFTIINEIKIIIKITNKTTLFSLFQFQLLYFFLICIKLSNIKSLLSQYGIMCFLVVMVTIVNSIEFCSIYI